MPTLSRLALLLVLPAALALSACDSHDDPPDDDHFGRLERVEVRDRDSGALYASYARAAGEAFEGSVPLLPEQRLALDVLFFDEDGREASLGSDEDHTLGIRLAEADRDGVAGTPGIVAYETRGSHADVEALAEGETHLVFQLLHGVHSDGDAPALRFTVGAR